MPSFCLLAVEETRYWCTLTSISNEQSPFQSHKKWQLYKDLFPIACIHTILIHVDSAKLNWKFHNKSSHTNERSCPLTPKLDRRQSHNAKNYSVFKKTKEFYSHQQKRNNSIKADTKSRPRKSQQRRTMYLPSVRIYGLKNTLNCLILHLGRLLGQLKGPNADHILSRRGLESELNLPFGLRFPWNLKPHKYLAQKLKNK